MKKFLKKRKKHEWIILSVFIALLGIFLRDRFLNAYTTSQSADIVIGQSNMTSGSSNQGSTTAANTLSAPYGIATDGTRLVIGDFSNHRVLIYNSIPTSNNASADIVLGQTSMTGNSFNSGGRTASTMNRPTQVAFAGSKLIVTENNNCRVLIWNTFPTSNAQAADVVVGEANFTTANCDVTAAGASPWSSYYDSDSGKFFIADYDYSRVLIYNSLPTSNGASANVVVGQTDMTSNVGGTSSTKMGAPTEVLVVNGKLLIVDQGKSRVLIYNSIPTSNGAAADVVIGQANMTSGSANRGGSASDNTLNNPRDVMWDGQKLYIADTSNNRVLVYNSIPTSNGASADAVIGQPDFTTVSSGTTASKMNQPTALATTSDCGKLLVTESGNNRVLIFNNESPCVTSTTTPTPTPSSDSQSSTSSSQNEPQIPQQTIVDSGGVFTPAGDSNTKDQKVVVVIEPHTFNFDAFVSSVSKNPSDIPALQPQTKPIKKNVVTAGSYLGVVSKSGTLWEVGHIQEISYKAYAPGYETENAAKIIPELQNKPSIVSLSYTDSDLVPPGSPRSKFNPKNLKIAHSIDGATWKILPSSVVDPKNKTVSAISKVYGYYMIVGK